MPNSSRNKKISKIHLHLVLIKHLEDAVANCCLTWQHICYLILCVNMVYANISLANFFSEVMVLDIEMIFMLSNGCNPNISSIRLSFSPSPFSKPGFFLISTATVTPKIDINTKNAGIVLICVAACYPSLDISNGHVYASLRSYCCH